jgi:hypothetical protein
MAATVSIEAEPELPAILWHKYRGRRGVPHLW